MSDNSFVFVEPADVWDCIVGGLQNTEDGDIFCDLIAQNDDSMIEITAESDGEMNKIIVSGCGVVEEEFYVDNAEDCHEVVSYVYETYLSGAKAPETIDEQELVIDDREQEIGDSIYQMLDVFVPDLDELDADYDEIEDDLAALICEYLYRKHGISVYRPMVLDDGTKGGYFTEYPYAEIDYDNP